MDGILADWRTADLTLRERAMAAFAHDLTVSCHATGTDRLAGLRQQGLEDRELLDVVQIVAYFNFVNRLVDGLGVSLEDER